MHTTEPLTKDTGTVPGRPEAAQIIWNWKRDKPQKSRGNPRKRAGIQALAGATIGTILLLLGHVLIARIAYAITGVIFLTAMVSPHGAYATIHAGMQKFGLLVGQLLNWVLLMPLFYLFFSVFRLVMRRGLRDSMKRQLDPQIRSYWTERNDPERNPEFYERQF